MGLETVAIGSAIGGSLLNAWGQSKQASAQNKRAGQIGQAANAMMQTQASPWENMLMQSTSMPMPNAGNDALMQLLRSDPTRQTSAVQNALGSMLNPNQSYSADPLFQALDAVDARSQNRAIQQLRGSAALLGDRFGSSLLARQQDLSAQMTDQAAARNQQLAAQLYNSQQGNKLNAAQLLLGANSQDFGQQLGAAQALNNAYLTQRAQMLDALRAGAAIQQGRLGMNAQLLGIQAGVPVAAGGGLSALGSSLGDIGQLGLLLGYTQGGNNQQQQNQSSPNWVWRY